MTAYATVTPTDLSRTQLVAWIGVVSAPAGAPTLDPTQTTLFAFLAPPGASPTRTAVPIYNSATGEWRVPFVPSRRDPVGIWEFRVTVAPTGWPTPMLPAAPFAVGTAELSVAFGPIPSPTFYPGVTPQAWRWGDTIRWPLTITYPDATSLHAADTPTVRFAVYQTTAIPMLGGLPGTPAPCEAGTPGCTPTPWILEWQVPVGQVPGFDYHFAVEVGDAYDDASPPNRGPATRAMSASFAILPPPYQALSLAIRHISSITPPGLVTAGQSNVAIETFEIWNDGPVGTHTIWVEEMLLDTFTFRSRDTGDPAGFFSDVRIVAAGTPVASAAMSGSQIRFTFNPALLVQRGAGTTPTPVVLALLGDVRTDDAEASIRLSLESGLSVTAFDRTSVVSPVLASASAPDAFPMEAGPLLRLGRRLKDDFAALPNPFNPGSGGVTTFRYFLPTSGCPEVRLLTLLGEEVAVLRGACTVGSGTLTWDGRNGRGEFVRSGLYLAQLHVDGRRTAGLLKVAVLR